MVRVLMLLLPGLIPSWKFFKTIEPSPRVQWRLSSGPDHTENTWQEFRPRPERVSGAEIVKRLFWNPDWNEALFLVSLAERLTLHATPRSAQEILRRIKNELLSGQLSDHSVNYLQFRLVFLHREGEEIVEEVTYLSQFFDMSEEAA